MHRDGKNGDRIRDRGGASGGGSDTAELLLFIAVHEYGYAECSYSLCWLSTLDMYIYVN